MQARKRRWPGRNPKKYLLRSKHHWIAAAGCLRSNGGAGQNRCVFNLSKASQLISCWGKKVIKKERGATEGSPSQGTRSSFLLLHRSRGTAKSANVSSFLSYFNNLRRPSYHSQWLRLLSPYGDCGSPHYGWGTSTAHELFPLSQVNLLSQQ